MMDRLSFHFRALRDGLFHFIVFKEMPFRHQPAPPRNHATSSRATAAAARHYPCRDARGEVKASTHAS
jgi:hypothetical protein